MELMSPSLEDATSDATEYTRSAVNYVLVTLASVLRRWSLRHNFTRETVVRYRVINPRSGVCLKSMLTPSRSTVLLTEYGRVYPIPPWAAASVVFGAVCNGGHEVPVVRIYVGAMSRKRNM